jgi:hypothetical protein
VKFSNEYFVVLCNVYSFDHYDYYHDGSDDGYFDGDENKNGDKLTVPVMMTVVPFICDMALLKCKSDPDVSKQLDVI